MEGRPLSNIALVTDGLCPLWGTRARTHRNSSFSWLVSSPRAGGSYIIDLLAFNQFDRNAETAARLTTWIINEQRAGVDCPVIDPNVLQMISARPLLRLTDRIDRFFLYLSSKRYRPGSSVNTKDPTVFAELCAWTESTSDSDFYGIRNLLISMRLLEGGIPEDIILLPAGYERLDGVEHQHVVSRQAFVAMWFGQEMQSAYDEGFALGIEANGFQPFRIDRKEHANKIDDEIVAEIRRSRFVVADFTCPLIDPGNGAMVSNARGGVYYEAGFAQGLGLPVIWSVRADCINHVHFDTRQFAHIVWNDPSDLRTKLERRIGAVIDQGVRA